MKKTMILAFAMIMAIAANAENKNVAPFEGVSVSVPARVRFVYGENYSLNIQAADSLTTTGIRWTVKDGVLKIRSIDELDDTNDVCITIESPVEPTLTVGRNVEVKATTKETEELTRA